MAKIRILVILMIMEKLVTKKIILNQEFSYRDV